MVSFWSQVLLASAVQAVAANNITLHFPREMPAWAEQLSPQLVAFSIEMDRWQDWAGNDLGQPNQYVNQLLQNLGERIGSMPFLRIGANSQDRASVDPSVRFLNATFPPPTEQAPNPEADHIFIGRDFYLLSGNLPAGTPLWWGLNLKSLNKTETVAQARLLADTFQGSRANLTKDVRLAYVEIGNEPDFYGPTRYTVQGPYGAEWDIANYSSTWTDYALAVSEVIQLGDEESGLPQLSLGAFTGFLAPEWTPEGALEAGVLDNPAVRSRTGQFAAHSYSGGFDPRRVVRPGELMNKLFVRANMTSTTAGVYNTRRTGLKYVLGETNSYAAHGQPGLSNTVESALWATDWLLLAASRGIERVHFHHGRGYRYNTFQPIDESDDGLNITHPHILPSYHALLIVNEAIGSSGDSWVAEIPTSNLTLTAYGVWQENVLRRLVVLNTVVYLGEGEKPSTNVRLSDWSLAQPASIKRLLSEQTTDYTGVTWAGQSFETLSGIPEGQIVEEPIDGGVFDLPASSIALVTFL